MKYAVVKSDMVENVLVASPEQSEYSGKMAQTASFCPAHQKKLAAGYVYNWIAIAPSSEGYAT